MATARVAIAICLNKCAIRVKNRGSSSVQVPLFLCIEEVPLFFSRTSKSTSSRSFVLSRTSSCFFLPFLCSSSRVRILQQEQPQAGNPPYGGHFATYPHTFLAATRGECVVTFNFASCPHFWQPRNDMRNDITDAMVDVVLCRVLRVSGGNPVQ